MSSNGLDPGILKFSGNHAKVSDTLKACVATMKVLWQR